MSIEIAPDLVDRQLRYMLDQIRLDDLARVDEIKAAASLASDFRGRGAPFSQLPVSDTPAALDALMARAVDLNLSTRQALGLAVVMGLNQVETRVATIMARNHGICMATIDRHVDLLARDFGRVGAPGWGAGGQETRVDEMQAAGQTWVACPRLFAMAHGNSLDRALKTLAKVEARDLRDKFPRNEPWGAQLRQAAPDMGHFLAGAIVHLDPTPQRVQDMVYALGLVDLLGAEGPVVEGPQALAWARAFRQYHGDHMGQSTDPMQRAGEVLIQRLGLAGAVASATKADKDARKQPRM